MEELFDIMYSKLKGKSLLIIFNSIYKAFIPETDEKTSQLIAFNFIDTKVIPRGFDFKDVKCLATYLRDKHVYENYSLIWQLCEFTLLNPVTFVEQAYNLYMDIVDFTNKSMEAKAWDTYSAKSVTCDRGYHDVTTFIKLMEVANNTQTGIVTVKLEDNSLFGLMVRNNQIRFMKDYEVKRFIKETSTLLPYENLYNTQTVFKNGII